MLTIKKILVPVDFSDVSKSALERACTLANTLKSEISVVHVWQIPEYVPLAPSMDPASGTEPLASMIERQAKADLDAFVAEARKIAPIASGTVSGPGIPSATIVRMATTGAFDLVVMGTHGRTGLPHVVIGSVAERVVRRSPCPVLTLGTAAQARTKPIRRILAPVDYSEGSRASLAFAASLAESLGAEIDVVHIWDRPRYVPDDTVVHMPQGEKRTLGELVRERAEGEMVEFLATVPGLSSGPRPAHRLLSGDPASTLLAELEKGAHDLVVLGTHGRTGIKRLLMGSVAETVVRLAPVGVVTIPEKRVD